MAKEANHIPDCISKSVANRSRKVTTPMYLALARPYLEYYVGFGLPNTRQTPVDILERVHCRPTKMIRGLEHMIYMERPRELSLFSH